MKTIVENSIHYDDETLKALAFGRLSGKTRYLAINRHLDRCPECAAHFYEICEASPLEDAFIAAVTERALDQPPSTRREACLSEAELRALAAGESGRDDSALLEHVGTCAECKRVLDEWRANLELIAALKSATWGRLESVSYAGPSPTSESDRVAAESGGPIEIPGYDILREIHRGGQGIVYKAVQRSTKRAVAVKVLLEGPYADRRGRWRFEREVRLIAMLRHPNIVVIHESGFAQGLHYFAMDYVAGPPLDTYARMRALKVREIVSLFRQVCEAVACAHGHGVIHRDLKPSNILVNDDGRPCVLDFGLAKITHRDIELADQLTVSRPGVMLGTLHYMAPEQTRGNPDEVDVRTDIYALGVILYELLTGKPPYMTGCDLAQAFISIREVDPPRPSSLRPEVRSELDAIVLKCLDKNPDRRYGTASALAQDLEAWMQGRPISAKSASSVYILRKLAARHSFETLVIMSLVLSMIGFGAIMFNSLQHARSAVAQGEVSEALVTKLYRDVEELQRAPLGCAFAAPSLTAIRSKIPLGTIGGHLFTEAQAVLSETSVEDAEGWLTVLKQPVDAGRDYILVGLGNWTENIDLQSGDRRKCTWTVSVVSEERISDSDCEYGKSVPVRLVLRRLHQEVVLESSIDIRANYVSLSLPLSFRQASLGKLRLQAPFPLRILTMGQTGISASPNTRQPNFK